MGNSNVGRGKTPNDLQCSLQSYFQVSEMACQETIERYFRRHGVCFNCLYDSFWFEGSERSAPPPPPTHQPTLETRIPPRGWHYRDVLKSDLDADYPETRKVEKESHGLES